MLSLPERVGAIIESCSSSSDASIRGEDAKLRSCEIVDLLRKRNRFGVRNARNTLSVGATFGGDAAKVNFFGSLTDASIVESRPRFNVTDPDSGDVLEERSLIRQSDSLAEDGRLLTQPFFHSALSEDLSVEIGNSHGRFLSTGSTIIKGLTEGATNMAIPSNDIRGTESSLVSIELASEDGEPKSPEVEDALSMSFDWVVCSQTRLLLNREGSSNKEEPTASTCCEAREHLRGLTPIDVEQIETINDNIPDFEN